MKNTNMNNNPIEELRQMTSPVSEQEWAAITSDKRYTQKFGHKNGLTPRGRAAIIGGVAAVLIAVPILVKTLTHKPSETAQASHPATETTAPQPTTAPTATTEATTTAAPTASPAPTDVTTQPNRVGTTDQAAAHERETSVAVIATRTQPSQNLTTANQQSTPAAVTAPAQSVPQAPAATNRTVNQDPPQRIPASKTDIAENRITDEASLKSEDAPEEVTTADEFFIPSAFTPNGDGLNDLFYVKANFEPRSYELSVFNRNGDLVFITRDLNTGWDGSLHGKTLAHGMYVYIIKYKDSQGVEQKKQGQILLIP